MDRSVLEFLAGLHGVTFDDNTSDEDLQKSLTDAIQSTKDDGGSAGGGDGGTPSTTPVPVTAPMQQALTKMAEDNEYVRAVLAELDDNRKRIAELETANRLQEVRRKMSEVGNARRILAPHVGEKLSELVAAMPPKAGNAVLDIVREMLTDAGTVELGERGRAAVEGGKDSVARFNAEVQKLMEADTNMGYADAVSQVSMINPDLFEAYRQSATSEWR
jgi:phage-related tail protein